MVDRINNINKNYGLAASVCSIAELATNFLPQDSLPLKLTQNSLGAARNYFQYNIYKRDNDELGKDKRERPLAYNIGSIACFLETKINPILVPLSTFFTDKDISNFFTILWWRIRLCCEGIKIPYIKLKTFKYLFSRDINLQRLFILDFEKKLSPILGAVGSVTHTIFTPLQWVLEDNKFINSLAQVGNATQHLVYLLKFNFNSLVKFRKEKKKEDLILFTLGVGTNFLNIVSPIIPLLKLREDVQNVLLKAAQGLNQTFFSIRRYFIGKEILQAA